MEQGAGTRGPFEAVILSLTRRPAGTGFPYTFLLPPGLGSLGWEAEEGFTGNSVTGIFKNVRRLGRCELAFEEKILPQTGNWEA